MNTDFKSIINCSNCKLYKDQKPLLDSQSRGFIFWVGLSAVRVTDVEYEIPLSPNTNSGKLIRKIESPFSELHFYKTNLVKCLPLKDGKIRYPTNDEMASCFSNFNLEMQTLKPKLIFLMGKQVASFVANCVNHSDSIRFNDSFDYIPFHINETLCVPVHHPSHILIFKQKRINDYITQIRQFITTLSPL